MAEEGEIIKREVGERVEIACHFEPGTVKAVDEEDGIFEGIVTTSEVDRHMESIATEGIDTDNWLNKSPTVLYGHDYFDRLPVGKGLSLKRTKNKMTSKFQMCVKEYPFAKTVADLVKGGYLTALSIGGIVREWSEDYKTILRMEMIEFSIVPIPANASAVITRKSIEKATGKSLDQIRNEFRELTHKYMIDKFKDLGDDELTKSVKVIETLLATLKESIAANSSAGKADLPEVKKIRKLRLKESAVSLNRESERVIRIIKLKPTE
jgi:HK97 family phage prohead protease